MELASLRRASALLDNLITVPFIVDGEPFVLDGEGLDLTINIDAFTAEFWRSIPNLIKERALAQMQKRTRSSKRPGKRPGAKSAKPLDLLEEDLPRQVFEVRALEDEDERRVYVDLLTTPGVEGQSPVLAGWSVKDKGKPVPPAPEVLMGLPTPAVRSIWLFCRREAETVKKLPMRPTKASRTTSETTDAGS